jgi:hypothetical protein
LASSLAAVLGCASEQSPKEIDQSKMLTTPYDVTYPLSDSQVRIRTGTSFAMDGDAAPERVLHLWGLKEHESPWRQAAARRFLTKWFKSVGDHASVRAQIESRGKLFVWIEAYLKNQHFCPNTALAAAGLARVDYHDYAAAEFTALAKAPWPRRPVPWRDELHRAEEMLKRREQPTIPFPCWKGIKEAI